MVPPVRLCSDLANGFGGVSVEGFDEGAVGVHVHDPPRHRFNSGQPNQQPVARRLGTAGSLLLRTLKSSRRYEVFDGHQYQCTRVGDELVDIGRQNLIGLRHPPVDDGPLGCELDGRVHGGRPPEAPAFLDLVQRTLL